MRLHRHPTPELLALALYLRWAVATYRRYLTLGIPEAVFWDTFQDFALWSEECMRVTGQPGLIEWGWNALLLHMELFRLGRLEYQPRTLQQDIVFGEVSLAAGTPILEVHIPAGAPFCQRELSASLCSAGPFFERYFQRTSLQRALKKYLLAGNHVGMGMGVAQRVSIEAVGEAAGAGPLHGFIP